MKSSLSLSLDSHPDLDLDLDVDLDLDQRARGVSERLLCLCLTVCRACGVCVVRVVYGESSVATTGTSYILHRWSPPMCTVVPRTGTSYILHTIPVHMGGVPLCHSGTATSTLIRNSSTRYMVPDICMFYALN